MVGGRWSVVNWGTWGLHLAQFQGFMAASAPFAVEHNRQACVGTIEDQFRPPRFASRQHRGRARNSPAVLEGTCQVAQPNSFGKRQKETGVCGEAKLRQTDKETELVILKARGRIEVEILLHRSRPVPPVPLLFSSLLFLSSWQAVLRIRDVGVFW